MYKANENTLDITKEKTKANNQQKLGKDLMQRRLMATK
jgi:hypothetical protein